MSVCAYVLLHYNLLIFSHRYCHPVQTQLSIAYVKCYHFQFIIKNHKWAPSAHFLFSLSPVALTLIYLCTMSPEIISTMQTFLNFQLIYLRAYWTSPLRYLAFSKPNCSFSPPKENLNPSRISQSK